MPAPTPPPCADRAGVRVPHGHGGVWGCAALDPRRCALHARASPAPPARLRPHLQPGRQDANACPKPPPVPRADLDSNSMSSGGSGHHSSSAALRLRYRKLLPGEEHGGVVCSILVRARFGLVLHPPLHDACGAARMPPPPPPTPRRPQVMEYCDAGTLHSAIRKGAFHRRLPNNQIGVDLPAILEARLAPGGGARALPLLRSARRGSHHPHPAPSLPPPTACARAQVLIEVAGAVEYFHGLALVHCDIKARTRPPRDSCRPRARPLRAGRRAAAAAASRCCPLTAHARRCPPPPTRARAQADNILLKTDPTRPLGFVPKLADFGLAKLLKDDYIRNRYARAWAGRGGACSNHPWAAWPLQCTRVRAAAPLGAGRLLTSPSTTRTQERQRHRDAPRAGERAAPFGALGLCAWHALAPTPAPTSPRPQTHTHPPTRDQPQETFVAGSKLTTAVDVYAFGVLMYELYSGARPYHGLTRCGAGRRGVRKGRAPQAAGMRARRSPGGPPRAAHHSMPHAQPLPRAQGRDPEVGAQPPAAPELPTRHTERLCAARGGVLERRRARAPGLCPHPGRVSRALAVRPPLPFACARWRGGLGSPHGWHACGGLYNAELVGADTPACPGSTNCSRRQSARCPSAPWPAPRPETSPALHSSCPRRCHRCRLASRAPLRCWRARRRRRSHHG